MRSLDLVGLNLRAIAAFSHPEVRTIASLKLAELVAVSESVATPALRDFAGALRAELEREKSGSDGEDLDEDLEEAGELTGRARDEFLRSIEEGLEDVRQGRTVPHEEVKQLFAKRYGIRFD